MNTRPSLGYTGFLSSVNRLFTKIIQPTPTYLKAALFTISSLFFVNHGHTQQPGLPFNYPTERREVDASKPPWNRIGNISILGRQFCTGTLVGKDLILTAAHCLWDKHNKKWFPPQFVHFLAGYQRGKFSGHSTGMEIFANPDFDFAKKTDENLLNDWAFIRLVKPLGDTLGFMNITSESSSSNSINRSLVLAGYRKDRREVLTIEENCQLINRPDSKVILSNCHSIHGDSGGPLLAKTDSNSGNYQLIALNVATHKIDGGSATATEYKNSLSIPASRFFVFANKLNSD